MFSPIRVKQYIQTGINVNSAATDVGSFTNLPAKYRVVRCQPFDASINLTTATYDLRTATGGGGTAIVAAQALSALTAASKFVDSTLAVTADYQTASTLTIRNVTAQGAPATCSFLLDVLDLS